MDDSNSQPLYTHDTVARGYNAFWPLVLLAVSLIVILGWDLIVAGQVRSNGKQLREQQAKMVEQSHQVQVGLEKLARDLIEVAKSDTDAKAIVTKYNISVSEPKPGAPSASASGSPAPPSTP